MEVVISPSQGKRFDAIVKKKPCVAKFHTPNCPYCIELEPVWKSILASPKVQNLNLNTSFLSVHADATQDIKSKCAENIVGVPTIMITYNNGKSRKMHNNANDFESILKFITDNKRLFFQTGGSKYKKSCKKKCKNNKHLLSQKRFKYTKRKKNKVYKKINRKNTTRKHH